MLDHQEKLTLAYRKPVLGRSVSIGNDSRRDSEPLESLNQDGKQRLEVSDSSEILTSARNFQYVYFEF